MPFSIHDTNDTKSAMRDIRSIPVRVSVARAAAQAVTIIGIDRRMKMYKISIFAGALILISVGAWAMTTAGRVDVATKDAIHPLQLMSNARNLPESHYVDYTFVFN